MIKKWILLLLFSTSFFVYAQTDSISLNNYERLLANAKHDTTEINILRNIENIHVESLDFKKAIEYENRILKIATKNKYSDKHIRALIDLSYSYRRIGEFTKGLLYAKEAIKQAKNFDYYKLGNAYREEAALYFALRNFDSLEISCENVIKYSKNKGYHIDANNFLGGVYYEQNDYEKAMEKFMQVRSIAEEIKDNYGITTALMNISLIYMDTNRLPEAIDYLGQCMEIAKENDIKDGLAYGNFLAGEIFLKQELYDKALKSFKESNDLYEEINVLDALSEVINSHGKAYLLKKSYDSAIVKFNKVITLERKTKSFYKTPTAYKNLAQSYYELDIPEVSLTYLDSVGGTDAMTLIVKQEYYELLSKLDAYRKDYKSAHKNYAQFIYIKDSIEAISKKKEAYVLEANYQFKQKEKEIEILNTKNELKNQQLYLLIGVATLILLILFIIYNRYRTNKKMKEKLVALDELKTRFFTNISHEFRTPLSLIIGYFEQKNENAKNEKEKNNIAIPHRNAERLHTLINQLLDLSKIESGTMPLAVSEIDINEFLRIIFSFFSSKAQESNIKYICNIDKQIKNGYLDKDKIEKILTNLLSNAFKFTMEGGNIHFNASLVKNRLLVSVSDTGRGISSNKLDKIFNRFYQVDDSSTRNYEGTGIGLALSKELADIHKGSLIVNSTLNKGSEFKLEVPINKRAYSDKEIIVTYESNTFKKNLQEYDDDFENSLESNNDKPSVLIVEDNNDMRSFISSILEDKYEIILATNGNEAYSLAISKLPNVIVSDYMMPEMNGLELCKVIKSNDITSHIPIVILTAKTEQESKLMSLEYGADSYLTKPFNNKELVLIIRNLLKQKEKIREILNKSILSIKEVSLPASEKSFFKKVMILFEDNYNKSNFGIDQLAENLSLSRSQLYRKVKQVTGNSPGDLLRNFRMEKAKKMLLQSSRNVGQIAIEVGFCNQSNFSKNFKVFTGLSPIDYVNKYMK